MKLKFETFFRGYVIVLVAALFWSVWAGMAQTSNTRPASGAAPAVSVAAGKTNTNAFATLFQARAEVTPEWVDQLAVHFPFLEWTWWGNEIWKYIASLVYIFLAFYISKFLDFLTRVWLKRWAQKTQAKFDELLLDLLNGPVKVVAFVIFLHIGLDVFSWPPKVQSVLSKGFTVLVACTLTYMALKFIDLVMGYWRQRAEADKTFNDQLFPIIRKSLKLFLIVVAVLVTSDNLEIKITSVLASLSIGGLAIGLAAQDTLANLFGAVSVLADKPFRIGDSIRMEEVEGTVETIGMRSTRVRNSKGYLVTIPNKRVGNGTITNLSRQPSIQTDMNIGLPYDTPAEKVRRAVAILDEVYRANPMTQSLNVSFNRFGNTALNIQVTHVWRSTDVNAYLAGMQEFNLTIKRRFDEEGIKFAPPG